MVIGVVVIIIVLAVALSAIGAWIVIQGKQEQEPPAYAPIDRSGSFAVLRHPVGEDLERAKPILSEIDAWLNSSQPQLTPGQVSYYLEQWKSDLAQTISIVEEGDREKIATFRVLLSDKDIARCTFLTTDNYLTREQILNHPEILPPYYLGCGCRLALKQPWDNPSKAGWKAVVPHQDGKYHVPDWRTLA